MCASSFRKRLASIGTSVSETNAETRIASDTMTANSWNSRPITPGMKKIGMNTATSEIEIEMMVKPTSREPRSAAWNGGIALLDVAHDVLEHHDGVVDDQADRERDAEQRDVVERVAEAPTAATTAPISETGSDSVGMSVATKRRRNRKITSTTSTMVPSSVSFTSCSASRIETERSLTRLIAHRLRQLRLEARQRGAHGVDHLHRVGVGLAQHGQRDRASRR